MLIIKIVRSDGRWTADSDSQFCSAEEDMSHPATIARGGMQPTIPFRRWPLKSDADGHAAIEIEEMAKMQLQANAPSP
jgi:hypothetical protein